MPFSKVSVDLAYLKGANYLTLVYHSSGWPEVKPLQHLDTSSIITKLEAIFKTHWPSDPIGAPQFRSDFEVWFRSFKIKHETSTPYNPTTMGLQKSNLRYEEASAQNGWI